MGCQNSRRSASIETCAGLDGQPGVTTSGITPTTVYGSPLSRTCRPTMSARPPNLVCHIPCETISTRCSPGTSSPGPKARPRRGCMPRVSKNEPETRRPRTGTLPSAPSTEWPAAPNAASDWKDWLSRCQAANRPLVTLNGARSVRSASQTNTSWSASGNGQRLPQDGVGEPEGRGHRGHDHRQGDDDPDRGGGPVQPSPNAPLHIVAQRLADRRRQVPPRHAAGPPLAPGVRRWYRPVPSAGSRARPRVRACGLRPPERPRCRPDPCRIVGDGSPAAAAPRGRRAIGGGAFTIALLAAAAAGAWRPPIQPRARAAPPRLRAGAGRSSSDGRDGAARARLSGASSSIRRASSNRPTAP